MQLSLRPRGAGTEDFWIFSGKSKINQITNQLNYKETNEQTYLESHVLRYVETY